MTDMNRGWLMGCPACEKIGIFYPRSNGLYQCGLCGEQFKITVDEDSELTEEDVDEFAVELGIDLREEEEASSTLSPSEDETVPGSDDAHEDPARWN